MEEARNPAVTKPPPLFEVDHALSIWEKNLALDKPSTSEGPDRQLVPSLLTLGSLSLIGGPWQRYDGPSQSARDRHATAQPPRFGHPDGYQPQSGVYL